MAIYDISVELKEGVNDAEGKNVEKALNLLGFDVSSVGISRVYRIEFESDDPDAAVELMCQRLLANPVIQEHSFERVE